MASDYKGELLKRFGELLICRDAYWNIVGKEMGLGKSWEPNLCNEKIKYCLVNIPIYGGICKRQCTDIKHLLAFPTEEIRDVFFKNYKELIEECKELL